MTDTLDHSGEQSPSQARLTALQNAALDLLHGSPRTPDRIRLRMGDVSLELDWATDPAPRAPAPSDPVPSDPVPGSPAPSSPVVASPEAGGVGDSHPIVSPTVGTFFRAPEPGAEPFVGEGDLVTRGQQIAIVEAMKLMLPVEADRPGRVSAVVAEDGQGVEYGETLFLLATDD